MNRRNFILLAGGGLVASATLPGCSLGSAYPSAALAVGHQGDHAGLAQVGDPGLAVVRVGRGERVGQRAAARLGLGTGTFPRLERGGWVSRAQRAAGQRGGCDQAAAGQNDEVTTIHEALACSGLMGAAGAVRSSSASDVRIACSNGVRGSPPVSAAMRVLTSW